MGFDVIEVMALESQRERIYPSQVTWNSNRHLLLLQERDRRKTALLAHKPALGTCEGILISGWVPWPENQALSKRHSWEQLNKPAAFRIFTDEPQNHMFFWLSARKYTKHVSKMRVLLAEGITCYRQVLIGQREMIWKRSKLALSFFDKTQ